MYLPQVCDGAGPLDAGHHDLPHGRGHLHCRHHGDSAGQAQVNILLRTTRLSKYLHILPWLMVTTCWIFVMSTIISTVVSPHLHYLANYQLILNVSPHWTSRPREFRSSGFRSRYGPPGNGKLREIQHLHLIIVANDIILLIKKIFFTLKIFFSATKLDTIGNEVITELGEKYINFSEEAIFLNTMGAILIGLAVLVPCVLGCEGFRKGLPREGEEDDIWC